MQRPILEGASIDSFTFRNNQHSNFLPRRNAIHGDLAQCLAFCCIAARICPLRDMQECGALGVDTCQDSPARLQAGESPRPLICLIKGDSCAT